MKKKPARTKLVVIHLIELLQKLPTIVVTILYNYNKMKILTFI